MDLLVDPPRLNLSNNPPFRCVSHLAFRDSSINTALQSMYINQLASEHIFDLLLAIASNAETTEFGPWNMVALDIFHLIFRCVKPEELIIPLEQVRRFTPIPCVSGSMDVTD